MARTVNEQEYASKRNDILNTARQLIFTKGYEQMTIQDMLNELKISSGAFYHHFDSKPAVLKGIDMQVGAGKIGVMLGPSGSGKSTLMNIIGRMIDREAPIIGALYALGYRRGEIYRHYLIYPLLLAVVGGVIGTILGTFPIRGAVTFYVHRL